MLDVVVEAACAFAKTGRWSLMTLSRPDRAVGESRGLPPAWARQVRSPLSLPRSACPSACNCSDRGNDSNPTL